MQISVNGLTREVKAHTLDRLLEELGYETQTVATALNQEVDAVLFRKGGAFRTLRRSARTEPWTL